MLLALVTSDSWHWGYWDIIHEFLYVQWWYTIGIPDIPITWYWEKETKPEPTLKELSYRVSIECIIVQKIILGKVQIFWILTIFHDKSPKYQYKSRYIFWHHIADATLHFSLRRLRHEGNVQWIYFDVDLKISKR